MLECKISEGRCGAGWTVSGRFHVSSAEILYHLGRSIVDLYTRLMFKMDVVWKAPLPDGPKIVAPNHPSTTDPFLIAKLLSEPTSILILDGLFKVPVFGGYLRQVGHVPVERDNGRKAFEAARQMLDGGRSVAIFPEGLVSPLEGGLHPPRTGVARLALLTGEPVVPVGIHLDRERLRIVRFKYAGMMVVGMWYLRGPYAMTVGAPMIFEGDVEDRARVRDVSRQVMQRIAHLSQESAQRVERKASGMRIKRGALAVSEQV